MLNITKKTKPRILFILHLPPPVHGTSAVGKCIKESNLLKKQFECDFVSLGTSKGLNNKSIVRIFCKFLIVFLSVAKKLVMNRYDLCYLTLNSSGTAFYKDSIIVALVKIFRVKLIYHFHNKGVLKKQNHWFDNILYKYAFNKSHVILLSKLLYYDIKKYVDIKNVSFCPNGIKLSKNVSGSRQGNNSKVKIMFLSNLIESKGVFVLLDACEIIKNKGFLFECKFVGAPSDITEKTLLKMVSEKGLTNHVFYMGKKYGADKDTYLRNADIFAFPTYFECFPLVLLEAMHFSLPIVSTYEGGIPDIVEDGQTGFLCPQKDAISFAKKLELLIEDKDLREQMGAAGYLKYKERFTLEEFENRFKNILLSTAKTVAMCKNEK